MATEKVTTSPGKPLEDPDSLRAHAKQEPHQHSRPRPPSTSSRSRSVCGTTRNPRGVLRAHAKRVQPHQHRSRSPSSSSRSVRPARRAVQPLLSPFTQHRRPGPTSETPPPRTLREPRPHHPARAKTASRTRPPKCPRPRTPRATRRRAKEALQQRHQPEWVAVSARILSEILIQPPPPATRKGCCIDLAVKGIRAAAGVHSG